MTEAERYARLSELVNEALDLEPESRDAFLDEACAADPGLRREVEEMLAQAPALDASFLESPPTQVLNATRVHIPGTGTLPPRIGPYRILSLLGEGGMGSVLLAEQDQPYRRKIALKLIQGLQTETRRNRFLAEYRALARLNHPNVAALFDAGTLEDPKLGEVPYVAMEWIDGLPIDRWCDRHRLGIEQRIALFQGACAGVQHAHEKGLLHCDLKPSNVLVTEIDGRPVAKIIDFGIARALDEPLLEATGQLQNGPAGSPAYMSPEAADLAGQDLDTRSDVYSLGLILYRLLLGVLPHGEQRGSVWTHLKRVRTQDARPLTQRLGGLDEAQQAELAALRRLGGEQLRRRLRGDLEAIVGKAVERDPSRRYASPAELVTDLGRHLRREPIAARPPSLSYVASRFVRRRWQWVSAACLLALSLAAGLVARTVEARRATAAAELAQQEALRAQQAQQQAEELADFLTRLFADVDPERRVGTELTVRELLQRGLEAVQEGLQDQPLTQARFLLTIGRIYTNLGHFEEATPPLERCVALRQQHAAPAADLAEAHSQLGNTLRRASLLEESLEQHQLALRTLQGQSEVDPSLLALVHNNLGNLYWSMDQLTDAEVAHTKALELRRQVGNVGDIAVSLNNLGANLRGQGRLEEAAVILQEAGDLFSQATGPDHPRTVACWYNLGLTQADLGREEQALPLFQQSLEIWHRNYGWHHARTRGAYRALHKALLVLERWPQSLQLAQRALEAIGDDGPEGSLSTKRTALLHRGIALAELERFDESEHALRQLVALDQVRTDRQPLNPFYSAGRMSWLLWTRGDAAEAATQLRPVLQRVESAEEPYPQLLANLRYLLAQALASAARFEEAEQLLRLTLSFREETVEQTPRASQQRLLADALHLLGQVLLDQGRVEEAAPLLRRALALREAYYPAEHTFRRKTQELVSSLDISRPTESG